MHNRIGFNRLGRKSSHRKALHKNMVSSLIKYGRIETTKTKAKEIRRTAEKLVTRAKVDSVHNRRIVAKSIGEKAMLNKLFIEIAPTFVGRPGGYTRILKLGHRKGDAAEVVILEFLKEEETEKKKPAKKKSAAKKAAPKKDVAPVVAKDSEAPATDTSEAKDAPAKETKAKAATPVKKEEAPKVEKKAAEDK